MQTQGTYTWHYQHDLKLKFSDLLNFDYILPEQTQHWLFY